MRIGGCLKNGAASIPDSDGLNISIFPNPTERMVYIYVVGGSNPVRVEIRNVLGNLVYKNEVANTPLQSIDLRHQPAGQYFIRVKIGEETFSEIITLAK